MERKRVVERIRSLFTRARGHPEQPEQKRSAVFVTDAAGFASLKCSGYTSLSECPEIVAGVDAFARLIGAMTIHLMQNTSRGDVRVINGLSRVVDITPNRLMTRSNFMRWIVRTMYLEGDGNAVVYPVTAGGYLEELVPIPAAYVSMTPTGEFDYRIYIAGREFNPDDLLHFVARPGSFYPWRGEGYRIALSEIANNLKQATATENGFMSSEWKPSLIVKVDALIDEFSGVEGRQKLLEQYVSTAKAGEPWLIPAEQFEVQQVKPLSLSDLALSDFVKLDKRTVASILGIPAFVLGVGEFNRDEWNSFVSTSLMPLAQNIQQELTRKLLYSPEMYFRFNARSLYNYDLRELAQVADDQYVRGIMTGNEVRDWINLSPLEGLDDLVILENYIPRGMIGDQSKLQQKGGNDDA